MRPVVLHTRDPRAEVTRAIIWQTTERMTHQMDIARVAQTRDAVLDTRTIFSRVSGRPAD